MFNALIARQTEAGQSVALETLELTDLPDNDVLVRVDYSTINYKDGLALTGAAPIIRSYPLVPGIDLAGVVESSRDQRWQVGDRVVVNGWGMGEGHWGGLAQYAQVKGDWLVKLPDALSTREAMCIGTAGYTAALCVDALITPRHQADRWRHSCDRRKRRRRQRGHSAFGGSGLSSGGIYGQRP